MLMSEEPSNIEPKEDVTAADLDADEENLDSASVQEAVENIFVYARDMHTEAKISAAAHFNTELTMARSLVASLALMALALYGKDRASRIFPVDWVNSHGAPDPDVVIALGLSQLANYGYAVTDLVEKGLETPARALLRPAVELSEILVMIVGDKEVFRAYSSPQTDAKDNWYQLFSRKRVEKRLASIERLFGMPEHWISYMREFRKEKTEFFSEAVHHSYRSIVIGGQPTVPGTDHVQLGLLGGPNIGSGVTLEHFTLSVSYCLNGLFALTENVYGFTLEVPMSNFWSAGERIFRAVDKALLAWLSQKHG